MALFLFKTILLFLCPYDLMFLIIRLCIMHRALKKIVNCALCIMHYLTRTFSALPLATLT